MNSAQAASQLQSWNEMGERWQELGQQWWQWWTKATTTQAADTSAMPITAAAPPARAALGLMFVDPQELAALNARYQPRFQALWTAAQNAMTTPDAALTAAIPNVATPAQGDRRFTAREWSELPYFALLKQYYLLTAEYARELAELAPLPETEKRRLRFMTRQAIDALAPSNFPATNPEVITKALKTEGASLAKGLANFVADAQKGRISMTDERAFEVGKNLAITPGEVIFRNELIELIQYAPSTAEVHRYPLLIVPPCINKYYILDLQPDNSFVRWTVAQGHTVLLVSWRNIPAELGSLTWDDYIEEGVLRAIGISKAVTGSDIINVLGFCVGGTLLAEALAVLGARNDKSIASVTFLTTLLDFEEPGDIGVYVSPEMLAARAPMLMAGHRIQGGEIAHAFASLRANDLVWNYVVSNYLKGESPPAFDLLYWNSDSANLPGPMYAYYLKEMYLGNRLREHCALSMNGVAIDLARITMPAYILAAHEDHIVPWKSAYRTVALLGGKSMFVLGASGHIAGVVNPPARKRRNYWLNSDLPKDADEWLAHAQSHAGSWWTHWSGWLAKHAGAMIAAPATAGNAELPPLEAAPGTYLREVAD